MNIPHSLQVPLTLDFPVSVSPEAGRILIDGIDISQVDKQVLRSRVVRLPRPFLSPCASPPSPLEDKSFALRTNPTDHPQQTFLAQDPVLFPGTLRQNLDPLNEHSDEACQAILSRIFADPPTSRSTSPDDASAPDGPDAHPWTLSKDIDGGGKNMSQGQRQLVGLARAVLRRSPILILDEATASIDAPTAARMQAVLHADLRESTVITIAHRVEAVRGAERAVVLGGGAVVAEGAAGDVVVGHGVRGRE